MSFRHDPVDALTDIIDQAARIAEYLRGSDLKGFEANGLVRDAVERCIERVCEAAVRLGETGPKLIPDQPWADVRGMGNWLRHAYHRVDASVVWTAATIRIPSLADAAREALNSLAPEPDLS